MTTHTFLARPDLTEIAELHVACTRADRVGDVVTAIALRSALRRALARCRTGQVAKRRLTRRTTT